MPNFARELGFLSVLWKQWFLVALALCVGLGFGFPSTFESMAHSSWLRTGIVIVVMVLMGWTLHPKSITNSLRKPTASLLAISVNVVIVPILSLPAIWFLPSELSYGLAIASIVPCTLASASVWTRAAGGDDSVAMMTTVVTNLVCFIVAPLGIWIMIGRQAQVDVWQQMKLLFVQVVIPLVVGQALRRIGFDRFADRHRILLANVAQGGILAMVLFGSVISAERLANDPSQYGWGLVWVGLAACLIHIAAVMIGYVAAEFCGLERPQKIAVAISGGQKTLMVGLQLAITAGASVMPMVMYHVSQLFIDTFFARFWRKHK